MPPSDLSDYDRCSSSIKFPVGIIRDVFNFKTWLKYCILLLLKTNAFRVFQLRQKLLHHTFRLVLLVFLFLKSQKCYLLLLLSKAEKYLEKLCNRQSLDVRLKNTITREFLYAAADDRALDKERHRAWPTVRLKKL